MNCTDHLQFLSYGADRFVDELTAQTLNIAVKSEEAELQVLIIRLANIIRLFISYFPSFMLYLTMLAIALRVKEIEVGNRSKVGW